MSFNAIRENKILAKISEFTILQLLVKAEIPTNKDISYLKILRCRIQKNMLINVKILTNVGILTFMSRINFVLS